MARRQRTALLAAGACGIALLLNWLLACRTGTGVNADARVYVWIVTHEPGPLEELADWVSRLGDPAQFLILAVVAVAIPLSLRRWRLAAAVVCLLVAANLTTQALQDATSTSRWALQYAQWPSGHVTAVASVVAGVLIALRAPLRGRAAVAAAAACAQIAWAVVATHMHLPSDALAALLVTGLWASLVLAVLQRFELAQASS